MDKGRMYPTSASRSHCFRCRKQATRTMLGTNYQLTESTTIPIKAYADDVCRMCHDRQKLKELLQLTATYCGQRGVALNQKKTYLYSINDITAPLTCYINVISL